MASAIDVEAIVGRHYSDIAELTVRIRGYLEVPSVGRIGEAQDRSRHRLSVLIDAVPVMDESQTLAETGEGANRQSG